MTHASIAMDPRYTVGTIDRRIFGSFVEHLGRCVYDGIYEPGHPEADAEGFRRDVLALVQELGVTTVRYPGGNFVSGYKWEDGIGPRATRPRRLDLAWHSMETNEVGLHEFADWADKAGVELMMAVNLGTRGVAEALDLLEYCNVAQGSTLSEQRRSNGADEPFAVNMWCLGNEMDGSWQLGHRSATDYGKIASMTAKAMRQLDPSVQLVACGSSNSGMPTFGAWEREVLEHTYEDVDLISCHAYYRETDGDRASFLASAVDMDAFIETVVATADHVKSVLRSDKTIDISFDEWNIWYADRWENEERITGIDNWPVAPRLLEDVYSVTDAVVFGGLLISLLKHADRVKAASLAQLVNVIAPIMTEPGGAAWRQTTFFPFALASRLARGTVLRLEICTDTVPTAVYGDVPAIDAVATLDDDGSVAVFVINRHIADEAAVTVDIGSLGDLEMRECLTLADDDGDAANTREDPERVSMRANEMTSIKDGTLTMTLPPASWTALSLARR
ncbi:alpha-N-arabinofuranosidase [Microbacterium foliorum]|uniref:non-reducing end alpha-L-arabinofuranosidase n=1 Tax=Microbacterium foliorum TaxID=104336 RepID=A0ABU1HWI3_9MICO|nr:alpha-N-arabinofuranosidase [Microbacterium foliorum]MDR6144023.1 alpha-N-arabinofuranosidase [Microbacterium foliorum]